MTSALFKDVLVSFAILSMLLLLGTFLRAKVKLFQKLFLPASVIGGFIGLILGPELLGSVLPVTFSEAYVDIWSLLPSILIVPIFAAVPLGLFMNAKKSNTVETVELDKNGKKKAKVGLASSALICLFVFMGLSWLQSIIGFGTNKIFSVLCPDMELYRVFGYELSQGFVGGHGSAGQVSSIYQTLGFDFWESAQGVTTATATIGLIGGMLLGIAFINAAARKGKTALLQKPAELSEDLRTGMRKNVDEQPSMGRETTQNSTIEASTLHFAIILAACGIGYLVTKLLSAAGSLLPVWIWAMAAMVGINALLRAFKLDWLIDPKIKAKITGTLSDFAIVAAIASVPLSLVAQYILPILVMCALGFVGTYLYTFKLNNWLLKDNCPFEHSIIEWGAGTGVMITGMMLLKICDPDYRTSALQDFSVGFSMISIISLALYVVIMQALKSWSTTGNLLFSIVLTMLFTGLAILVGMLRKRKLKKIADVNA